jgi:hypothetical protein
VRPETITLDIDATLVASHSDKELASGTYKGGFGFHPLCCYLDETDEALAAILRPGNAGSNTADDHFDVLGLALDQIPEADLDREILVRADVGGATHAFTRDCRDADIRFTVGCALDETVRSAILELPQSAWQAAIDAEGEVREGAWVAELTEHVSLSGWPEGTRLIARRERPHPGAQFGIFDSEGYRHTCFLTDQQESDIAALKLRHRRRARVEDRIRAGKDTGMRNVPFSAFAHNQAGSNSRSSPRTCSFTPKRSASTASLRTPSQSGCASACCMSPGASSTLEFPRFCGVLSTCGASAAVGMDTGAEDEAAVSGAVPPRGG